MCCNLNELADLGTGYALHFQFKKYLTWLLFLLTVIISIPCLAVVAA